MNILIIDDHKMFSEGLSLVFSQQNKDALIHTSANISESMLHLNSDSLYDVIILDLTFPDVDGLDVLRICLEKKPLSPVLMVSSEVNIAKIYQAKKIGASGFVAKSNSVKSISDAITSITSGELYYQSDLTNLFNLLPKKAGGSTSPLSRRQQDVMELIYKGYDNKTIAELLFISVSTVKTHINAIFQILDVHSRSACIKKAKDSGLL
jgi:DNA-binding NarL/FixJ family response regulator